MIPAEEPVTEAEELADLYGFLMLLHEIAADLPTADDEDPA